MTDDKAKIMLLRQTVVDLIRLLEDTTVWCGDDWLVADIDDTVRDAWRTLQATTLDVI